MPLMTLREVAAANGQEERMSSYAFRKKLADELLSRGMIVQRVKIPDRDLGVYGRYYYGMPEEFEPYRFDFKSVVIPPGSRTKE